MIRLVAALAVALFLSPGSLGAQTPILTVNAASADVHKSPSVGSPVVGRARKGTVIAVTRELGSWVKVSWPDAADGVGYVHVKMGLLGTGSPSLGAGSPSLGTQSLSEPRRPVDLTSTLPAPEPIAPVARIADRPAPAEQAAPRSSVYVTPATHVIGLGGRVGGSTPGVGATARAWSRNRIGLQLELSRHALNTETSGRVTSIQFEPSLLVSLPDHVTDFVWMRPYVGSGVNLRQQTQNNLTLDGGPSVSENKLGFQVFGGTELTFAAAPPFALSLDVAYHRARTSFTGVDFGGLGVSVAGHWYVK